MPGLELDLANCTPDLHLEDIQLKTWELVQASRYKGNS